MTKLTTYFYVFKNSIVNPAYYNEIVKAPFGFSFKYFLMNALVFSVLSGAIFMVRVFPEVEKFAGHLPDKIVRAYPEDLVFYVQGGQWYINKAEPYVVPFSFVSKDDLQEMQLPKNFLVLYKKGTIDDVKKLDTLILINEKNMLVLGENGAVEASPLGELPNIRLTQQQLERVVAEMRPVLDNIVALTAPLVIVGIFIGNFVGQLLYLLWLAALIWIIGMIMGKKVGYGKAYQIGMHAITLPWLLKVALSIVLFGVPMPFWFTVVAVLVASFGLARVGAEVEDSSGGNTVV